MKRVQRLKLLALATFSITSIWFTSGDVLPYVLSGQKWTQTPIYDKHTLSSAWASAITFGSSQWTLSTSIFQWQPGDSGSNDVYSGAIDGAGATLATTTRTSSNGIISRMTIKFDSGESWYTGSGTPSSTQYDLRSAATHEFGHGLGLSHTQSSFCTSSILDSAKPTMCASLQKAKTYPRSLQGDDKNGASAIYPTSLQREISNLTHDGYELGDGKRINVDFLYGQGSLHDRIGESDLIVSGVITFISATSWNQDSGQYWEDPSDDGATVFTALPYYTVEMSYTSPLIDRTGTGSRHGTFTILGFSPADAPDLSETSISEGIEVVAMFRRTEISWRSGTRDALVPVGMPGISILKKVEDHLVTSMPESNESISSEKFSELLKPVRSNTAKNQ